MQTNWRQQQQKEEVSPPGLREEKTTAAAVVDPDWKGLYKAGGIGLIIVGVLYFVEIPLFFVLAPSLAGADAAVKGLAGQALTTEITIGFAILSHLASIPGVLALYLVLKGINKNAMLVAVAFLGLYIILDMAVATPSLLSLITLSQSYAGAASDAQRVAYLATGTYAFATFSTSTPVYGSLVPSIGVLITALVMRKGRGVFRRGVAYLGVASGIIGSVAGLGVFMPALTILDVGNLVLFGTWLVLLGWRVRTLGR